MTKLEFRFFGVPVRIHLWFLLSALLLGGLYGGSVSFETPLEHARWLGIWVLIVFQGVFCHEVGHALVGRSFGLAPRIDLVAFGGQTSFVHGPRPIGPGRSLLVSAAGPAVSVLLGLATLAASALWLPKDAPGVLRLAVDSAVLVNLVWGLLNLLPMLPLDGGQILMSLSEMIAPRRGRYFASVASLVFAALMVVAMVLLQQGLLAMFAALFAWTSYQIVRHERSLRAVRSDDPLGDAEEALAQADGPRLGALAMLLLEQAHTAPERDQALRLLAWAHLFKGELADATQAFSALGPDARDAALEGSILLELGKADDALPLLEQALTPGSPLVRAALVRAILETERFAEAAELFEDERGRDFSADEVAEVYRAALAEGPLADATALGKAVYQRDGDGDTAVEVARCLARLDAPEEALGWLEKARLSGYADLAALDADPALAPIRALPAWQSLREDFAA